MSLSFTHKNRRPWPNRRLKIASIVGHTTATKSRLWVRTGSPGPYRLLYYPEALDADSSVSKMLAVVPFKKLSKLPKGVRRKDFEIEDWEHDTTKVLDLRRLKPDTRYRYALYGSYFGLAGRKILLGHDRPLGFRTMPAKPHARGPMAFGFYSCHMPYKKTLFGRTVVRNDEMWECFRDVLARREEQTEEGPRVRFLLGGGDQVYADGVSTLNIWKYLDKVMCRADGKLVPDRRAMLSFYRDIYRGYWGFDALQEVFASHPHYMMWDDHELGDGWGSFHLTGEGEPDDEIEEILPSLHDDDRGLTYADGRELLERMGAAGKQVYTEYQHSHNPPVPEGRFDYSFTQGDSEFFMLDGRGTRDVNRARWRILGEEQWERFDAWLADLDPERRPFAFVNAAVPLVDLTDLVTQLDGSLIGDLADVEDDLRDGWEHPLHDEERQRLLAGLFAAADRGMKICLLSGDVHVAGAFRLIDPATGAVIYQLTTSAITYNVSRPLGFALGKLTKRRGTTGDGYRYKRLALYTNSNFALVEAHPEDDRVEFQLFGAQSITHPDEDNTSELPILDPVASLELSFERRKRS